MDSSAYLDSLPPHSLLVYLGSSTLGNPGPVGAGAFIVYTHPDKTHLSYHLFHPVGHAAYTSQAGPSVGHPPTTGYL